MVAVNVENVVKLDVTYKKVDGLCSHCYNGQVQDFRMGEYEYIRLFTCFDKKMGCPTSILLFNDYHIRINKAMMKLQSREML